MTKANRPKQRPADPHHIPIRYMNAKQRIQLAAATTATFGGVLFGFGLVQHLIKDDAPKAKNGVEVIDTRNIAERNSENIMIAGIGLAGLGGLTVAAASKSGGSTKSN